MIELNRLIAVSAKLGCPLCLEYPIQASHINQGLLLANNGMRTANGEFWLIGYTLSTSFEETGRRFVKLRFKVFPALPDLDSHEIEEMFPRAEISAALSGYTRAWFGTP